MSIEESLEVHIPQDLSVLWTEEGIVSVLWTEEGIVSVLWTEEGIVSAE